MMSIWARLFSGVFVIMGNVNLVGRNGEMAKRFYASAIEGKTKSGVAYINYSVLLMQDGRSAEALPILKKGLSLKRLKTINKKNMLLTTGTCLWLEGDVDGAIETLESLRAGFDYVNPSALTTLGYMYLLKGDYDAAETVTMKALAEDPNFPPAVDNLGQIYYRQGDFERAKASFGRVVETKELVDSLFFLGDIAERENDLEAARDYFRRASAAKITSMNTVKKEDVDGRLNKINEQLMR